MQDICNEISIFFFYYDIRPENLEHNVYFSSLGPIFFQSESIFIIIFPFIYQKCNKVYACKNPTVLAGETAVWRFADAFEGLHI